MSTAYRWQVGDVFTNGAYRWRVETVAGDRAILQSCSTSWARTRLLTFDEWREDGRWQLEKPAEGRADVTFEELRAANLERLASAWPAEDPWEPWDWTNAITGEVGEACVEGLALLAALSAKAGAAANLTKKMNRVWPAGQFATAWNKPEDQRLDELSTKLARELADVVIYADLLASKIGRSLGDCVRDTFNAKSEEIGSPVRIAGDGQEVA